MRYKLPLIGFVIGAFVIPAIVVLGLVIPYVELLKPLAAPGRLAAEPFIESREILQEVGDVETGELRQVSTTEQRITPFGWIAYFGVNGLCYAGIFWLAGLIAHHRKSHARKR